ncbi:MAG: hypothetical protein IT373_05150 [Polyangiaceae bacterium]|nr:hypothetical protein [Polyangiaceae bacterium]
MKANLLTLLLLPIALAALSAACGGDKCAKLKELCATCAADSMERFACDAAVTGNDDATCAEALRDTKFFAACGK